MKDSPVLPVQLSVGLHSTLHNVGGRGCDPGDGAWWKGEPALVPSHTTTAHTNIQDQQESLETEVTTIQPGSNKHMD